MSDFDSRPLRYAIYKGMKGKNGVLQFDMKPFEPANIEQEMSAGAKRKAAKGAVFIDAAKAVGENVYDYKNDIKFAMSETDLGQFLIGTKMLLGEGTELVSLYHKIERNNIKLSKSLKVKQGREDQKGLPTFMITLTEKGGDEEKFVTVPVSASEMLILRELFTKAVTRILGW